MTKYNSLTNSFKFFAFEHHNVAFDFKGTSKAKIRQQEQHNSLFINLQGEMFLKEWVLHMYLRVIYLTTTHLLLP